MNKASMSNIAYLIYHSEQFDNNPAENDYEELMHSDLATLNEKLHANQSNRLSIL